MKVSKIHGNEAKKFDFDYKKFQKLANSIEAFEEFFPCQNNKTEHVTLTYDQY